MAKFRLLARGVLCSGRYILLAHNKKKPHTFLPGGRVTLGESVPRALQREFLEETGLKIRVTKYLGAIEHRCRRRGALTYEVNLVFRVSCRRAKAGRVVRSREPHLEFLWRKSSELGRARLEPAPLRRWIPRALSAGLSAVWASTLSK